MSAITVATSALPVSADPALNAQRVVRQMTAAADQGADVVHFPECCLSGYAGVDFASYAGYDWDALRRCTEEVQVAAQRLTLHVVVGSTHRLTRPHKPHNSVYVVGPDGAVLDRYDKLFCAGPASADAGDLAHYSSGDHFCTFDVGGVTCGVLICHDYRYPELYRQYTRRGVQVMLHSYHAGNASPERWADMHAQTGPENHRFHGGVGTLPGITMPATMVSMAANNHVWISASNTSARQSCWPSFVVRPDGVMVGRLRRNRAGLLITRMDTAVAHYDSTAAWRDRSIDGLYRSGPAISDPRSADRTTI